MPKVKVPGLSAKDGNLNSFPLWENGKYRLQLTKSSHTDNSETKGVITFKYEFAILDEPNEITKSVLDKKFVKVINLLDETHDSFSQDMYDRNSNELANLYKALKVTIKNDEMPVGPEIDNKNIEVNVVVTTYKTKKDEQKNNFVFEAVEE